MIKLIHVLCFLAFMSLLLFSLLRWRYFSATRLQYLARALLVSLLLSVVVGALLVHQKGYFFTTPWIQAAFILCTVLLALLLAIFALQRKRKCRCWVDVLLLLSFLISIVVAHDAVTKTTELFG